MSPSNYDLRSEMAPKSFSFLREQARPLTSSKNMAEYLQYHLDFLGFNANKFWLLYKSEFTSKPSGTQTISLPIFHNSCVYTE